MFSGQIDLHIFSIANFLYTHINTYSLYGNKRCPSEGIYAKTLKYDLDRLKQTPSKTFSLARTDYHSPEQGKR